MENRERIQEKERIQKNARRKTIRKDGKDIGKGDEYKMGKQHRQLESISEDGRDINTKTRKKERWMKGEQIRKDRNVAGKGKKTGKKRKQYKKKKRERYGKTGRYMGKWKGGKKMEWTRENEHRYRKMERGSERNSICIKVGESLQTEILGGSGQFTLGWK